MEGTLNYGCAADSLEKAGGLGYLLRPLHWMGMLCSPESGPKATLAFFLRSGVNVLGVLLFLYAQLAFLGREGTADFDQFTMSLATSNTTAVWLLRITHAIVYRRDFQHLVSQMSRDFAQFMRHADAVFLERRGRSLSRMLKTYLCVGAANLAWWLVHLVARVGFTAEGLPYYMALPKAISGQRAFAVIWVFISYVATTIDMSTMIFDSLNVSLMAQLQLQLILLSRNLHEVAEAVENMKSSELQNKGGIRLVLCVRQNILHHQHIIRNALLLEKRLSSVLLWQNLSLGFVVCIQLYQIAMSADSLADAGKFSVYLCIISAELFMYCWVGEELLTESQNVSLAGYSLAANLHGCPISLRRSLLILMTRAKRPLQITAGGLFPMSRESFVAVVNMSYSFFAIIRNFKED